MWQSKCKSCLAGGKVTRCSTDMVVLLHVSAAALKKWRAGDVSPRSWILSRVGRKKVVPRLLVSLLSLLGIGCQWQGWPPLLELLPAPVVSFAQHCMWWARWVSPVSRQGLLGYHRPGHSAICSTGGNPCCRSLLALGTKSSPRSLRVSASSCPEGHLLCMGKGV